MYSLDIWFCNDLNLIVFLICQWRHRQISIYEPFDSSDNSVVVCHSIPRAWLSSLIPFTLFFVLTTMNFLFATLQLIFWNLRANCIWFYIKQQSHFVIFCHSLIHLIESCYSYSLFSCILNEFFNFTWRLAKSLVLMSNLVIIFRLVITIITIPFIIFFLKMNS